MSNHLLDDSRVHDWLRTLDENPGSAHHALVFSDWLDEMGYPAHAEMIRLHHDEKTQEPNLKRPGGDRYTNDSMGNKHPAAYTYVGEPGKITLHLPLNKEGTRRIGFYARLPTASNALSLRKALNEEGSVGGTA